MMTMLDRIKSRLGITALESRLAAAQEALESRLAAAQEAIDALNRQAQIQQQSIGMLSEIRNAARELESRLNGIDNRQFENLNHILHQFNILNNASLPELSAELHEVCHSILATANTPPKSASDRPKPLPMHGMSFETSLERARDDFASVYDAWRQRLDATAAEFAKTKVGNAAHAGDTYSRLFKVFVERHARGQILDVGCGPFGVPYYLSAYSPSMLSGLEPLAAAAVGGFEPVRGISEYLPWSDDSFETVISATSLDHCLSLDKSIKEMIRVLAPGGRVLLWIGSTPGAKEFRPLDPTFEPADDYHLFHFDTAWFEPLLESAFALCEKQQYRRPGYAHVFYCLAPHGNRLP